MAVIIGLIIIAILLALGEILLPGGILGVFAFLSLAVATWFTFDEYGGLAATLVFTASSVVVIACLFIAFRVVQKSRFGERVFLGSSVEGRTRGANPEALPEEILGKQGETLTPLVPTGMIQIEGVSYEAFSQSGYIEKGQTCRVVGKDNFRLIVRPDS